MLCLPTMSEWGSIDLSVFTSPLALERRQTVKAKSDPAGVELSNPNVLIYLIVWLRTTIVC
jgi:hypothetical protein